MLLLNEFCRESRTAGERGAMTMKDTPAAEGKGGGEGKGGMMMMMTEREEKEERRHQVPWEKKRETRGTGTGRRRNALAPRFLGISV